MRILVLAIILSTFVGCGYSSRSLLPGGAQKVAVDVFGNEEYYRELGIQLTRELSSELRHRSHYRVSRRRDAELLITGRILHVKRPTLIESDRNRVSEQGVIVTAEVELRRLADDKVLSSFRIANRAEFIVERGESLQSAFDEALHDLAENIVNEFERSSYVEDLEAVRAQSEGAESDSQD